jgi:hypothetical protein
MEAENTEAKNAERHLLSYHKALLIEVGPLPTIMALDLLARKLDVAFLKLCDKHPSFDWIEASCIVDVLRHTIVSRKGSADG